MRTELIKSLTPIILAVAGSFTGSIIIIVALLIPGLSDSKFSTLANLATTAIATGLGGAAGVAQQSKNQIENIENVEEINK